MPAADQRTDPSEKTTERLHPGPASGASPSRRSTLSPVRRAYQAVVLVGYAVLGVAVPMVVSAIREWRKP